MSVLRASFVGILQHLRSHRPVSGCRLVVRTERFVDKIEPQSREGDEHQPQLRGHSSPSVWTPPSPRPSHQLAWCSAEQTPSHSAWLVWHTAASPAHVALASQPPLQSPVQEQCAAGPAAPGGREQSPFASSIAAAQLPAAPSIASPSATSAHTPLPAGVSPLHQ